jgi:transcriptional regulator GlxA family with amidase domain
VASNQERLVAADFPIVFALYPRITQLDFTGPLEVLARLPGARCVLASVEGGSIQATGGVRFADVVRLSDVSGCALLCVPGGFGTVAALEDESYLSELRRLGTQARYITAVCTGSLLLAAAGLLRGKRAACHWAWRDLLSEFGVTPDAARVVRDGNVVTGGGVTAGIDLALTVMAEIAGIDYAQTVQLALEYAPEPPFECGRPERARAEIIVAAQKPLDAIRADRADAVGRAAQRLAQS